QGSERTRREIDLQLELGLAQILVSGWGSEPVGRAYQQAYGLALQAGTTFQMCRVLLSLDQHHRNRGDWRTARTHAERSVTLSENETDIFLRHHALLNMGAVLYHFGEVESA